MWEAKKLIGNSVQCTSVRPMSGLQADSRVVRSYVATIRITDFIINVLFAQDEKPQSDMSDNCLHLWAILISRTQASHLFCTLHLKRIQRGL